MYEPTYPNDTILEDLQAESSEDEQENETENAQNKRARICEAFV